MRGRSCLFRFCNKAGRKMCGSGRRGSVGQCGEDGVGVGVFVGFVLEQNNDKLGR